jgi:hypothetical protein
MCHNYAGIFFHLSCEFGLYQLSNQNIAQKWKNYCGGIFVENVSLIDIRPLELLHFCEVQS